MNLYLLEIIIKFIRMIFITFISIFNLNSYFETDLIQSNSIVNKNNYAINIIKDDTSKITKQNKNDLALITKKTNEIKTPVEKNIDVSKKPSPVIKTNEVKKTNVDTTKDVKPISNNSKATVSLATYTGRLTGYGPDCVGCSKVGNVACLTRERKKHSLIKDGIYYNDTEYGKLRIIAAATTKFKCGTVINITKDGKEPFNAIVLDTGGTMINQWKKGNVWMDLAYSSEAMSGSDNLTGKNIKFDVQRWGW